MQKLSFSPLVGKNSVFACFFYHFLRENVDFSQKMILSDEVGWGLLAFFRVRDTSRSPRFN
jgi:hypothetical protein